MNSATMAALKGNVKGNFSMVFSAFRNERTLDENMGMHSALCHILHNLELKNFKHVMGNFREEGQENYSRELSLEMQGLKWGDVQYLTNLLCHQFHQDCVLVRNDKNGRCITLNINMQSCFLGVWMQVRSVIHCEDAYTKRLEDNTYWICTEPEHGE